ncbi:MAG: hypothetical protein H0W08_14515, partial [Acidobacteria bacterium]|nr:hypothetical protein [Acidobacteriota bacterium]
MTATTVTARLRHWFIAPTLAAFTALAVLAAGAPPAEAQSGVGAASVSGIVTDESKAAMPGVTVTATNLQTGV